MDLLPPSLSSSQPDPAGVRPDLSSHALQPGTYQIVFETKEYFERTDRKTFYPFVQVSVAVPFKRPLSY
jgi:5-hydroxyisourate hydrolase-like protein (transthyretin family)